ncbi:SMI1/KNR4 family protein [Pseudarthrobacter sp. IC2-21]|uniref:SMI1/KNR4 family protein n=1 Tax=Pseudarthrobacter sp. IC2-21 TaxID=3092262 RepID=UPI002A6A0BDC|nr:SMI1/KNR4 family protein [Pseudarthrobacter sp. IC2-21]
MGIQKVWTEIVEWLSVNAPETARTIRAPAPEALIRSFEQAAPTGWHKDLSTLYLLFDGAEPSTAGYIFPNYRPLPLKEAGKTQQMLLDIWARVGEEANALDEREKRSPLYLNLRAVHEAYSGTLAPTPHQPYDPARAAAEEAGTRVSMFISSFLPVADDGSGDFLFIDLRKGRRHGCISEYFKEEADWRPAIWPSLEALLADTLLSLRTGQPALSFTPTVAEGELRWGISPGR